MASFLSESYPKPKLMETHYINKMIEEKNNKITFEQKAFLYIKNFIFQQWKIISVVIIIIALFFWRYKEIQNIRNKKTVSTKYKKNIKYYEDYSDSEEYSISE